MRPLRLFISYASKDAHWKDRMITACSALIHAKRVEFWFDGKTEAGERWEKEIFARMAWADGALLLISENFIASDYIMTKELPELERKHIQEQFPLLPILLKPCYYEPLEFLHGLQLLNMGKTPLSKEKKSTQTMTELARRLDQRIQLIKLPESDPLPPVSPPAQPLTLSRLLENLPDTSPKLFGRENEWTMLDKVRKTKGILVWVAGGGTGKSALVRHWLMNSDWPKETRFLGHSFYSQGSQDQTTTSAPFLKQALQDLGVTKLPLDNFEQGQLLAQTLRTKPTVLVLDGVEPLQHGPDGHHQLGGLFKDQGLVGLLSELARQPGEVVCLVSSRVHLADLSLQEKKGRFIWQYDLNMLPEVVAVELMKYRGVNGLPKDLLATAQRYKCHALALVLVSEYLHTFHQGRVEKALEIPLMDESTPSGRHAKSVMRAYDIALQKAGEELDREMVRLLGLFDRPAEWSALEALQQAEPIPGLTHHFRHATPSQVAESLARLRQWGLLNPGSPEAPLDAHPLVREWFGQTFQQEFPTSFTQAHKILFHHYQQVPEKHQPDTLEELEPLYRAIRHGCLAGEYEEACTKVYWDRIRRGDQAYSLRNLGAHSSDLSALSGFFPDGFDQMPVTGLSEGDRSWLVAEASFLLMSLGRLREAVGPRRVRIQMVEQAKDWLSAAIDAQNLTDLLLPLGRLGEAAEVAEQGVAFAGRIKDREKNLSQRIICHACQGRVSHYLGRMAEAGRAFQQAEVLQIEFQPSLPRLYSIQGTVYALFLLEQAGSQGEREEVLDRGRYIGEQFKDYPDETAFGHLVTGLALESLGRPAEGASQLQAAVADMRRAGINHFLTWLL
ncbi:MAG: toll/interleukin-1 receptor domain-containing protein, partial [Magnetococcales bacterium]|nr:toll/interleukin-1 receptor domain-containing protein [Magnetococcales bacterium]